MAGNARNSKRQGVGVNRGAINPVITVLLAESTATALPSNPRIKDTVIDASTTGSVVVYVWDGSGWR
jgi:hypothetical protein